MSNSPSLSREQARRISLAAQGMASTVKSQGNATWPTLEKTIDRLNLLQIDSVNVVCRSHYLPVFARVGRYRHAALDGRTLQPAKREVFEYWAHEASLLPMRLYPYMRWRMDRAARGVGIYKELVTFAHERRDYVSEALNFIRTNGACRVCDLPDPGSRDTPDWWSWSPGKTAMEYLFWTGELTASARRNFERIYDLPERVIPAEIYNAPAPPERNAIRNLLRLSARALGVGTETDLRDYFRLPVAETKVALNELIEAGELEPVTVERWKNPAYLARDVALPSRATGSALLSPFDPLVWERSRAERLFNFRYRIEIYTPAPKRVFGYYVLPFLHKGRMAGRVCLKADRQAATLKVNAAHAEAGHKTAETAEALSRHLWEMSQWLGLEDVSVLPAGNLATMLEKAVAHPRP